MTTDRLRSPLPWAMPVQCFRSVSGKRPVSFDRRQKFVASVVYNTNFSGVKDNAVGRALLNGWTIAPILNAFSVSGLPGTLPAALIRSLSVFLQYDSRGRGQRFRRLRTASRLPRATSSSSRTSGISTCVSRVGLASLKGPSWKCWQRPSTCSTVRRSRA